MDKNGMSEQEINMWSVLISVLKNLNREEPYILSNIEMDIYDIKYFIENGEVST